MGTLLALLIVAACGTGLWLRSQLLGSLPLLEGEVIASGLSGAVAVERDELGIPTIRASGRPDVALALGFVHAQDRFFQMDLLRRRSAGELSEIFGAGAVGIDSAMRIHRFRDLAKRVLESSPPENRAVLDAYTQGVNAGLAALENKPFEYMVLQVEPSPWADEDSILVMLSMFVQLQRPRISTESIMSAMYDLLPAEFFEFLMPEGDAWDAPLVGEPFSPPPIPSAEVFNLRRMETSVSEAYPFARPAALQPGSMAASSAWAVAGAHAAGGGALLVDDLHLDLSVPNIWYRAAFSWPRQDGEGHHRITGATLPGSPAMVMGSNTMVAWGFSNSVIDTSDVIWLDVDPNDPDVYLTPEGPRRFERHQEILRIKGGEQQPLEVKWTIWGPVMEDDHRGRQRAVRWVVHEPGAVDYGILHMETARDLDQALEVARGCGTPALSAVLADSTGRVAWTIMGRVPHRVGFEGRLPGSWADGTRSWTGLLPPAEVPHIADPDSGRVWAANNRLVDGEMLDKLGRSGYVPGARARQIRDALFALEHADTGGMLAILLDHRALFLKRWGDKLLAILTPEAVAAHPRRGEARELVTAWEGRASIDAVGYRVVRNFRATLARKLFPPLTAAYTEINPEFDFIVRFMQFEGPLWQLVSEEPMHLLDPQYQSWNDVYLEALDETLDTMLAGGGLLREKTWGEHNVTSIRHPMSRAIPGVGRWLDMAAQPLPGDMDMPRIQAPNHGSTLRMVVSPGREEEGIAHMPCGQSGHPLSPHYRDGHAAWANGEPTPFLPGPALHTLQLSPPR
ncbi:MAG: penicillin acylase family protein [bacterium]|nr:penicillin acylase family protein [bacterium]